MKAALASALLLATTVAHATTSYNGDFIGLDTTVTQADTLSDMFVFDQVNVLDPHVTTIWGNFLIYTQFAHSSLGLNYQIRTGISNGNGGTLVASGSVLNLQQTPTGRSTNNGAYPEIQLLGTVDLTLAPGIYWLGLQNNEGNAPPAQWTSSLAQTLGGDVGPSGDPNPVPQNAILDQSAFATGTELGDYVQQGADVSIGLISVTPGPGPGPGPTPLPEPATAWLLGVGAMGLFGLTRRRAGPRRGASAPE